jgi:hypothetical protein
MSEPATFVCNAVEVFDLADLRRRTLAAAKPNEIVDVFVRHPDREMDGSCRWCGCRVDETVRFER